MTKWRQTALLLLILPAQLSCVKAGNNDIRGILQPHKPLQNEEITLGSSCIYKLGHLSPETVYSVRISYPSSEPTLFEIEPIELATSPGDRRQERSQFQAGKRGLRDTAIIRFETGKHGQIVVESGKALNEPGLKVSASLEGVMPSNLDERTTTRYNILVEPVLLGVSYTAYYTITAICFITLFSVFVCAPILRGLINSAYVSSGATGGFGIPLPDDKKE
eukprot:gb/GECG01014046.1/.p1 GENE.gb/GECG01014046.1/~~gb/GECG01014046.1/.p1  ORF type:complete len:220 (+),score=15.69 gb/GECG01014046.1/:1-660(+)